MSIKAPTSQTGDPAMRIENMLKLLWFVIMYSMPAHISSADHLWAPFQTGWTLIWVQTV